MTSVCSFCLSRDRHLSPPSSRTLPLLAALFSELSSYSLESGICFECAATLRRVLRFQHRTACAQYLLNRASGQPETEVGIKLKSLSSLCSTINTRYDATISLVSDISERKDIPNVWIKNELSENDYFIEVLPDVDTFDRDDSGSKNCFKLEPLSHTHENEEDGVLTGVHRQKKQSKKNRQNKKENIREQKRRKSKSTVALNSIMGGEVNVGLKENENNSYDVDITHPTYECNYCNKIFSSRLRMLKHFKRFVGGCMKKQNSARRRVKSELECPDCSMKFTYRCNLVEHSRTHSGEKPHECKQCGKRYTQIASLNRHIRTHNEDRRFVCTHCGQRFVERRTLTDHYNIHTGIRPYLCSECGKSFTQKGSLRTHCKTHSVLRVPVGSVNRV